MSPYDDCQHCGTPNGVGLVMVSRNSALRRCRSCMRDYRVELPPCPQPRSLYLDQWALSNLAKALLPETRDRRRAAAWHARDTTRIGRDGRSSTVHSLPKSVQYRLAGRGLSVGRQSLVSSATTLARRAGKDRQLAPDVGYRCYFR